MRHARTYATLDGGSRFEDVEVEFKPVPFIPGNPPLDLSEPRSATAAQFTVLAPAWDGSWHTTPRRQYAVTLAGEWEVTTTDGETRRFPPGCLVLLDDKTGRGHNTRVVGDGPVSILLVALAA
jgi:hypothetical protein